MNFTCVGDPDGDLDLVASRLASGAAELQHVAAQLEALCEQYRLLVGDTPLRPVRDTAHELESTAVGLTEWADSARRFAHEIREVSRS